MRVLVACEFSGVVRRAFAARGHYAVSVDLLGAMDSPCPQHLTGDWREALDRHWDLMIAFPPCTHLAVSGAHRFAIKQREQADALAFVRGLMEAPIDRIAIENPIGVISTRIRKPDQIIQPYDFGHDASKRTCLWLKNLPTLRPTAYVWPRLVKGKPRWANQTDSGQNRETPHPDRWKRRSITYQGIADAMAQQWGNL